MPLISDIGIRLKKSINKPEPTFIRNYNNCFNFIEKTTNVQAYRVAYDGSQKSLIFSKHKTRE